MKTPSLTVCFIAALLAGPVAAAPTAIQAPGQIRIDILMHDYEAVAFDHAGHVDMVGDCSECHHHTAGTPTRNADCARCHGNETAAASAACKDCHPVQPFSSDYLRQKDADLGRYHIDKPGLKAAYHRGCVGCHDKSGGPTGCLDCHGRTDAGDRLYRSGSYRPTPQHAAAEH